MSVPSTNTSARKPSYLGSYDQPSPPGSSLRDLASWGASGGESGRGTLSTLTVVSADHATEAEEDYVRTLFRLYEAGLPMTGANLARAMHLSAPTVHEMLGRLERDGYVTRADDKTVNFTDGGREHAEAVVSRHRLI